MNINLINGAFEKVEALELIEKLFLAKINFHESKIHPNHNEEDVKMRESKIKQLHKYLINAKKIITNSNGKCHLNSEISISVQ